MWFYVRELFDRGFEQALSSGSSTRISLLWLGFGLLIISFLSAVAIEWFAGGRNVAAMKKGLNSWKSYAASVLALLIVWLFLFGYSVLSVTYADHRKQVAAEARICPSVMVEIQQSERSSTPPPSTRLNIKQGAGSTANLGVVSGTVKQNGNCNVIQTGGSGNTASPNCLPPKPEIVITGDVSSEPNYASTTGYPITTIKFSLTSAPLNRTFFAVCDRPCIPQWAWRYPRPSALTSSDFDTLKWKGQRPNEVGWRFNVPMDAGQEFTVSVQSQDDRRVTLSRLTQP